MNILEDADRSNHIGLKHCEEEQHHEVPGHSPDYEVEAEEEEGDCESHCKGKPVEPAVGFHIILETYR